MAVSEIFRTLQLASILFGPVEASLREPVPAVAQANPEDIVGMGEPRGGFLQQEFREDRCESDELICRVFEGYNNTCFAVFEIIGDAMIDVKKFAKALGVTDDNWKEYAGVVFRRWKIDKGQVLAEKGDFRGNPPLLAGCEDDEVIKIDVSKLSEFKALDEDILFLTVAAALEGSLIIPKETVPEAAADATLQVDNGRGDAIEGFAREEVPTKNLDLVEIVSELVDDPENVNVEHWVNVINNFDEGNWELDNKGENVRVFLSEAKEANVLISVELLLKHWSGEEEGGGINRSFALAVLGISLSSAVVLILISTFKGKKERK